MTFAEKLLRLRRREGLSQEALADALGVSRQAVSRWEQGTALPDGAKLLPCAKYFGVSVDWLLDEARGLGGSGGTALRRGARLRRPEVVSGGGLATGAGVTGLVGHGDFERCLSGRGVRGPGGGGLGPCLHRPGRLFEAARCGVALRPVGGSGAGGAVAAGTAGPPAAGGGRRPVSPAGTPPEWRRPCTALARPPGMSSWERRGTCLCWSSFWRRLLTAPCGCSWDLAERQTSAAGGRAGSWPCSTPPPRGSSSC